MDRSAGLPLERGQHPVIIAVELVEDLTRVYTIEGNPDLASAWATLADDLLADSGATTTASFTDSLGTRAFYRVRAKLPLAP